MKQAAVNEGACATAKCCQLSVNSLPSSSKLELVDEGLLTCTAMMLQSRNAEWVGYNVCGRACCGRLMGGCAVAHAPLWQASSPAMPPLHLSGASPRNASRSARRAARWSRWGARSATAFALQDTPLQTWLLCSLLAIGPARSSWACTLHLAPCTLHPGNGGRAAAGDLECQCSPRSCPSAGCSSRASLHAARCARYARSGGQALRRGDGQRQDCLDL